MRNTTNDHRYPWRELGELIAQLPSETEAKRFLDLVKDSFPSPARESVAIAFWCARVNYATTHEEITYYLEQAVEWECLRRVDAPIRGIPFYIAGPDRVYVPANPRDRRTIALIEIARRRSGELNRQISSASATAEEK